MSQLKKTFTPFLIPTTAMLLVALSGCEERQAGEKASDRPNQAVDQRANQPDTQSGRAQNNPVQGDERHYQGDTQRQMGNATGGTTTGGTTGGTTAGTTGGTTAGTTGGTAGTSGGTAGTSTGDKTTDDKTTDDKTTD